MRFARLPSQCNLPNSGVRKPDGKPDRAEDGRAVDPVLGGGGDRTLAGDLDVADLRNQHFLS